MGSRQVKGLALSLALMFEGGKRQKEVLVLILVLGGAGEGMERAGGKVVRRKWWKRIGKTLGCWCEEIRGWGFSGASSQVGWTVCI